MESEKTKIKTVFCGSSFFANRILNFLLSFDFLNIDLVLTHFPKCSGRGLKLKSSLVKKTSDANNLNVLEINKISEKIAHDILDQNAQLFIICESSFFVPDSIVLNKTLKTINIHPSLLPRWRGSNPIRWAIWKGDCNSGITLMELDKELDSGRIYSQKSCRILKTDNFESLTEKLLFLSFELLENTIPLIINNKIKPIPQSSEKITWTEKLTKKEEILDLSKKFWLQVRSLSPKPGAYLMWNQKKLKILELASEFTSFEIPFPNGIYWLKERKKLVLKGDLGVREILVIKKADKKAIDGKSFFNGYQKQIKAL